MTNEQWETLLSVCAGNSLESLPIGFIIDCPWLPGWAGISTIDYFSSDQSWLDANLRAIQTFPDILFLPGFWMEYGMCTEPAAFGARCVWHQHEMPFADKIIHCPDDIDRLSTPNPETDGLCPFVLHRLETCRPTIEANGHAIRFAVARGPLNIASFMMGTTEFMMGLYDDADRMHQLLTRITDFLVPWLCLQKQRIDSIDAVLILDDIVGFLGQKDFETFALPYLKRLYDGMDVSIKMFHNDANGKVSAPYLADIGINLFNFGFEHSLAEMRDLTRDKIALLGNIPPRDVLALGTPGQIQETVRDMCTGLNHTKRLILSCGGGMPDGVSTENIEAFINAARDVPVC